MIFEDIPKITKIAAPEGMELTTDPFKLNNYKATSFLVETASLTATPTLKITMKGHGRDGAAKEVRFLLRNPDEKEFAEVEAEGITITLEAGKPTSYLIAVTADMLSHEEFDSVSLKLESSAADVIATTYALQTQPRSTSDDE